MVDFTVLPRIPSLSSSSSSWNSSLTFFPSASSHSLPSPCAIPLFSRSRRVLSTGIRCRRAAARFEAVAGAESLTQEVEEREREDRQQQDEEEQERIVLPTNESSETLLRIRHSVLALAFVPFFMRIFCAF